MAALTSAQLIDRTEEILEDSSNDIFTAAIASSTLQEVLKEASFYVPWEVEQTLFAVVASKDIDVSSFANLREVLNVNYKGNRNFAHFNKMLRMDINFIPTAGIQTRIPILTTTAINQVLTGTVTFTAGSTDVTGSGTAFTTELQVGYYTR